MRPFLTKDTSRSSTVSRGGSKTAATPGRSHSTNPRRDFVYSHGTKLHAYSKADVPYPFSYDKRVFELGLLDRALIYCTKGSVSFHDFKGDTPKRVLDLGCGLGDWVIDAAKAWPDCTFVGFDVVDVQVNLKYVDPSAARRIQWIHGNFLERLPFRDGEFDYVHLFAIAYAVPEDKWYPFFDEVNRVLKPGGVVQSLEEDAIFPVLPRWFTSPLHSAIKRAATKAHEKADEKVYEPPSDLPHDHACLEHLFNLVFESRFLNQTPTLTLPGYFSASFNNVVSPPILYSPMPPLAPLPPFDRESVLVNRPKPTPPVATSSDPAPPEIIGGQASQTTSPSPPTQIGGFGKAGTPLVSIMESVGLSTAPNATITSQLSRPSAPSFANDLVRLSSAPLPNAAPLQAFKTTPPNHLPASQPSREPPTPPSRVRAVSSDAPPVPPKKSVRHQLLPSSGQSSKPSVILQTSSVPSTPSPHITSHSFKAPASPPHITPPLVPPRTAPSQLTTPPLPSKPTADTPHISVISAASIAAPSSSKTTPMKTAVHETPRSASQSHRTTPAGPAALTAPPLLVRAQTAPPGPLQVLPPSTLHQSTSPQSTRQQVPPDHSTPPPPPPKSQALASWPTIGPNPVAVSQPAAAAALPNQSLLTAPPGGAVVQSANSTTSTLVSSPAGSSDLHYPPAGLDLQRISSTVSTESKTSGSDASSLASSHSLEKAMLMPGLAAEGESIQIGGDAAYELFAMREFYELDEHSLFLTMYRAVGFVCGLKEAMWEELATLARRHDSELYKYGWEDGDFMEERSRERFDAMWEQFTSDMRARYALWYPAVQYGWAYPRQDPMTESEVADLEDLRRSILEARSLAKEGDIQPNMRSVRLLVGQKAL